MVGYRLIILSTFRWKNKCPCTLIVKCKNSLFIWKARFLSNAMPGEGSTLSRLSMKIISGIFGRTAKNAYLCSRKRESPVRHAPDESPQGLTAARVVGRSGAIQ